MKALSAAAERALRERCGFVLRPDRGGAPAARDRYEVAQPVEIDGKLHGAVVLEVDPRPQEELAATLRQLRWGIMGLEAFARRQAQCETAAAAERLQIVLGLVAALSERAGFQAAATHFVTEIAMQLACERVGVGFQTKGRIALAAVSGGARRCETASHVRAIEAAMDEAADQKTALVFPNPDADDQRVVRAHADLARQLGAAAIFSTPLIKDGGVYGVLTFERETNQPFTDEEQEVCNAAASLAGPMLEVLRRDDRWLTAKAVETWRRYLQRLLGPDNAVVKLVAGAMVAASLFLAFARGDYRVTAEAVLEPQLQRAAAAPFSGYLAEAPVRAGDVVREGELLAQFDDRELRLERLRWASQLEQLAKQNRQALAEHDRAQVRILTAGIDQARAELALIEDKLARARVTAPFDGIVVQGDLSQALGAPVERGDVLFELAPLDDYRLVLEVDERDIRDLRVGQTGWLVLSAAPSDSLRLDVTSVTPVSEAEEGRNYFRVEAELRETPDRLRPGMEGVAKVEIDRRRLAWIWTHNIVDWLRLAFWSWMP
jgi:RND family efflux transporter MFP subunit